MIAQSKQQLIRVLGERWIAMAKRYRSEAIKSIHQTAADLRRAGLLPQRTMREFDELCLTAIQPMSAQQIRALRRRERVSQAVFARHLNVTTGLVSQWERGEKHPRGPSLKLLSLVHRKGLNAIA
jgi:putative transcriptional regulator